MKLWSQQFQLAWLSKTLSKPLLRAVKKVFFCINSNFRLCFLLGKPEGYEVDPGDWDRNICCFLPCQSTEPEVSEVIGVKWPLFCDRRQVVFFISLCDGGLPEHCIKQVMGSTVWHMCGSGCRPGRGYSGQWAIKTLVNLMSSSQLVTLSSWSAFWPWQPLKA